MPLTDRFPVVLDTDLGSDVDDLLALIMLANEPRADLVGVTTVYGDVVLRARLACHVLRLMGRAEVPVHAGTGQPQSGQEVWWAGHEGGSIPDLERESISPVGGVEALIDAAARHAGDLVVIAIGPLTNIAEVLDNDPAWAQRIRRLIVMGGEFEQGRPEHNFRSDVLATAKVLASGIPAQYVGLDVTTTVWFDEAGLVAATASGTQLASLVDSEVRTLWRHIGSDRSNPHDPLAVLALLEPELLSFERGGWQVVDGGDRLGALERSAAAPVIERCSGVDVAGAREAIIRRLSAAIVA